MRFLRYLALVIAAIGFLASCRQSVTHIDRRTSGITGVNISVSSTTITQCPATVTFTVTVQGSGQFDQTYTFTASSGTLTKTGENTWTWQATTSGTYTFTATAAGDSTKTQTVTVTVNCPQQPGGGVNLDAQPRNIILGQNVNLTWNTANVQSCTASATPALAEWSGSKATSGSQQVTPSQATVYTFNLVCLGLNGQTVSASVQVNVSLPGTITITPTSLTLWPPACPASGPSTGTLTANMSVTWASSNPAVASVNPTSGTSTVITAHAAGTATITATGPQGQTATVTVTVNACPQTAPTLTLTANPTSINVGQSSTLTWNSANATSCTASGGWSGSKALSGSQQVSPTTTTTYTLTCTGPGGSITRSVTVTVTSVTQITITPTSLTLWPPACPASGPSTGTLTANMSVTWSRSNTTVASVGTTSGTSTVITAHAAGTATITATGPQGQTATVTVTVNACPPPMILFFSANPTRITRGQSSTLSWDSQNTTACTASGGWSGSRATSGTQSVSPTTTTTYTLTCTGPGGSVSASVTVTVDEPATVISVTIQPDTARCSVGGQMNFGANVTVTGNASTAVTWSVSNPAVASVYQTAGNQVTLNCHQVGVVTVTARAVADNTKSDNATGIVIAGTMSCTWSPASGLQPDGSVRILAGTTVAVTGNCVNEHGVSFLPYWFSSGPSRVGVQASQTVVIGGTTYYAGNNATITGIAATTEEGELVCNQSSVSQTSPAFCRRVVVHQ